MSTWSSRASFRSRARLGTLAAPEGSRPGLLLLADDSEAEARLAAFAAPRSRRATAGRHRLSRSLGALRRVIGVPARARPPSRQARRCLSTLAAASALAATEALDAADTLAAAAALACGPEKAMRASKAMNKGRS